MTTLSTPPLDWSTEMDDTAEHLVVVRERQEPADGIVVLTLGAENGSELPEWPPGAHVDVLPMDDEGCRQYSLCGSTQDRSAYRVAVLREENGRGFSRRLHDEAQVGTRWRLRGPRTNFHLRPAERYLFVAGGIGITPLLPMIEQAESQGRPWKLLYGGRSVRSMAFLDELATYGERVQVWPQDERGLLPLDDWLGTPEQGTEIYCCGPEPLLLAVEDQCRAWPHGSLHTERFAPKELTEPVLHEAFEVELKQSGMTLQVPVDKSILQVVGEAGIPTLSACQEGTCGTCETAVLEGVPDHRDSILDEDERAANDYMMICISRSCTRKLVLDL